jgi:hypothetical protein
MREMYITNVFFKGEKSHSRAFEWMRMGGNGCEWMRMTRNGWEWQRMSE